MLAIQHRFHRPGRWALLASLWVCCAGCSICPSPYDYDYGTYGTKTPRTNMSQGRVGSVFSESAYENANHDMIALPEDILVEGSIDQSIELAPGEIIIQ
ncbi:MAG: hypothetical protein ACKOOI_19095 [Pirellula sp.]